MSHRADLGITVRKSYWNKGIGSMLLNEIEKCFPGRRYELFTSTRSEDNIRLYKKLGYKIFDRKEINDELVFVYLEKKP